MRATGIKREKLCRTFGQKMMLRPERCASPKCAFTRRSYAPGAHGQSKRRPRVSAYRDQLVEKQRARIVYGVSESALKDMVRKALSFSAADPSKRNALDIISEELESRLDNIVFRLGLAPSRAVARQLVSHGHILVDGRKVSVPSFRVKKSAVISIRPQSTKSAIFTDLGKKLSKQKSLSWLSVDAKDLSGKVVGSPERSVGVAEIDFATLIEFYSR